MSALHIPSAVLRALRAHGEEAYPQECCGILLGRPLTDGWRVVSSVRATNLRSGSAPHRYEIAPAELARVAGQARREGLEMAGFYHSHPDHPPHWSQTDLAGAHWLGCSYVITEVVRGRPGATRSFRLAGTSEEDKRFEPESIVVQDESG